VSKTAGFIPQDVKLGLYKLGPISTLIRRFLTRISPSGHNVVMVSSGEIRGMKLNLDLGSEKDYWLGTYEVDLQNAVKSNVREGWVVYDIGANVGYISLVLAKAVGEKGQVIAFEALPTNVDRLYENIHLNGLDSRIMVVPGAVTDESGEVKFLVGPSGAMGKVNGSAGRKDLYHEAIEVSGIALDDFVYKDGNPIPQLIKMDIEGGEVLALKGMTRLISEARPLIFLELHGSEAASVAWEILNSADYTICKMNEEFTLIPSLNDLNWKSYLVGLP
jgi:FkbM family methyltransferase